MIGVTSRVARAYTFTSVNTANPDVAPARACDAIYIITANTVPTTIAGFNNAPAGGTILLRIGDGNTTIAAPIVRAGRNTPCAVNDWLQFTILATGASRHIGGSKGMYLYEAVTPGVPIGDWIPETVVGFTDVSNGIPAGCTSVVVKTKLVSDTAVRGLYAKRYGDSGVKDHLTQIQNFGLSGFAIIHTHIISVQANGAIQVCYSVDWSGDAVRINLAWVVGCYY